MQREHPRRSGVPGQVGQLAAIDGAQAKPAGGTHDGNQLVHEGAAELEAVDPVAVVEAVVGVLSRTVERRQDAAVGRVGGAGNLVGRDAVQLRLGPVAILLAVADEKLQSQATAGETIWYVDGVEHLAAGRPAPFAVLRRVVGKTEAFELFLPGK